MGRAAKRVQSAQKPIDHVTLDSFKPFQGMEIASIDDLAKLMEEFGMYRIYIRSPNSKAKMNDRLEAEEGTWECGIRLNKFYYDWVRSGPCDTLHEALERCLGVKVVPVGGKPVAAADEDEGLLV
jgi:hypothetical protein